MAKKKEEKTKEVKLMSVYRDTYVEVEGHGLTKITHAYAYGGPQLAIKTLNTNLDLNISEFVTVNFEAVAEAIDLMGGIEITIEKERRWWAKHGRDVWELELLDKVRLSNVEYEVIEVCQKGVYKLQTNEYVPFHSIYVTNDQSKIGGKDGIELIEENNSKVVCFREDRKDV